MGIVPQHLLSDHIYPSLLSLLTDPHGERWSLRGTAPLPHLTPRYLDQPHLAGDATLTTSLLTYTDLRPQSIAAMGNIQVPRPDRSYLFSHILFFFHFFL